MKRLLIFMTAGMILFFLSCSNKKNENTVTENVEKQKYEVKYLEDFEQFENHDQMAKYFGEKNVIAMDWSLEEGTEQYKVSILNPGYRHKIFVFWDQESGGYTDFAFVEAVYNLYDIEWEETEDEGETYESRTGIYVGMSLIDLEKLNGAPVGFYGLGWDYGGYVYEINEKFSNYTIALYLPDSYLATPEGTEAYLSLAGDHECKSDDEAVKDEPFEICRISYKGK